MSEIAVSSFQPDTGIQSLFERMDERFFAPVADLRLLPDWTPPQGREGGRFLNRQDGSSLEFKQHRSYGPGDDVRRVDWAVYGRTKKLFTRLVESEHTPELVIAVDHSASMAAGGTSGKFGAALEYALLLAFVALNSDYRVRLVPFGPPAGEDVAAQSVTLVHPRQILSFARDRLSTWSTTGQTDFDGLGEQSLAWRQRGASLVVVSDFLIDVADEDLSAAKGSPPAWFTLDGDETGAHTDSNPRNSSGNRGRAKGEEARAFGQARQSARARILASLDRLHQALEPLKTPNVRAVLMAVTGAGEQSLIAARSVFDLESGFVQRVLFTRASERAYQAARLAHSLALKSLARDLGAGFVAAQGFDSIDGQKGASFDDNAVVAAKRAAIGQAVMGLGFGAYGDTGSLIPGPGGDA